MTVPDIIHISIDVPAELKARSTDNNIDMLYIFNFTYNVVASYSIITSMDGGNDSYALMNIFPTLELKGGLGYYDFGWKIFSIQVQEKYAEYVAENEILGD